MKTVNKVKRLIGFICKLRGKHKRNWYTDKCVICGKGKGKNLHR